MASKQIKVKQAGYSCKQISKLSGSRYDENLNNALKTLAKLKSTLINSSVDYRKVNFEFLR